MITGFRPRLDKVKSCLSGQTETCSGQVSSVIKVPVKRVAQPKGGSRCSWTRLNRVFDWEGESYGSQHLPDGV